MEEISVEKLTLHEGPLERVRGWSTEEEKVLGEYRAASGVRTQERIFH